MAQPTPDPKNYPPALSPEQSRKIRDLCGEGYKAYDQGDFRKALRVFYQAWVLLPKPQSDYVEAGWVLVGLGDTYYRLKQYTPACEALRSANHCPQARNNPFIHLRLGQCFYHLGERVNAREHLLRAWQEGGDTLFQHEDPTYATFLQAHLQDES